jgi:hypothetical protein
MPDDLAARLCCIDHLFFPFSFRGTFLWVWGVLAGFRGWWPDLNYAVAGFRILGLTYPEAS